MIRAPLWLFALLLLAIIGLGVYGYFTTPLPLGLSSVIRTPGGLNVQPPAGTTGSTAAGSRTAAGQPLVLGVTNVVVQAVQRNQNLSTDKGGPAGAFTLVTITVQNNGSESLTPQIADFRLIDDRARLYAVDLEATRAVNTTTRHRVVFDSSVPPGGEAVTVLAFETAPDASTLTLRVRLGYGEVELPR